MGKEITIREFFQENSSKIESLLPKDINPNRFIQSAVMTINVTTGLSQCNMKSLFIAVAKAAQYGLMVGITDEAYIIKYKNEAVFQPSYKGLIKLARRSGEVFSLYAHCVYEEDDFSLTLGTTEEIYHSPKLSGSRGNFIGVYAVAVMKNHEKDIEYMSEEEVNLIRDESSVAYNSAKKRGDQYKISQTPWVKYYGEMAKKTVIKRLSKRLPLYSEFPNLFSHENYVSNPDNGEAMKMAKESDRILLEEVEFNNGEYNNNEEKN